MKPIRPSYIPEWAFGATASTGVVEPLAVEKAIGWQIEANKPRAGYFNWQQYANGNWLRYLSYDRLVDEDFCGHLDPAAQNSGAPSGWQFTGLQFLPKWWSPSGQGYQPLPHSAVGGDAAAGIAGGLVSVNSTRTIWQAIGALRQKDVLFEARAQAQIVVQSSAPSGGGIELGFIDEAWFSVTGLSGAGHWFFNWRPSGPAGTPTAVDFGFGPKFVPFGSSGAWTEAKFERVGSTMIAEVDGVQLAFPNTQVLGVSGGVKVGQRGVVVGGASFVEVMLDRVVVGVRR